MANVMASEIMRRIKHYTNKSFLLMITPVLCSTVQSVAVMMNTVFQLWDSDSKIFLAWCCKLT